MRRASGFCSWSFLCLLAAFGPRELVASADRYPESCEALSDTRAHEILVESMPVGTFVGKYIEILGYEQGQHGGHRIVFRLHPATEKEYHQERDPITREYLGDPSVLAEVLHPQAGHFFGFEKRGGRVFTIPDRKELNLAIRLFNAWAEKNGTTPIPLSFFTDTGKTPTAQYNERVLKGRQLPIGTDGPIHFHEMTFHVPSLLLPTNLLSYYFRTRSLFNDFPAWVAEHHPDVFADPAFQASLEAHAVELTLDFDNHLGHGMSLLSAIEKIRKEEWNDLAYHLFFMGVSPANYFKTITLNQEGKSRIYGISDGKLKDYFGGDLKQIEKDLESFPYLRMRLAYLEWAEEHVVGFNEPLAEMGDNMVTGSFYLTRALNQRIEEINRGVNEISKK